MHESGRPLEFLLRDWASPSEIMSLESKLQKLCNEYGTEKPPNPVGSSENQCDVKVSINQSELEHDEGGSIDPSANFRFQPPASADATSDHHLGVSDSEINNSNRDDTDADDRLASSLGEIVFDDSDEESESEFAYWWRDIPRQLVVQGQRMGEGVEKKASQNDLQSIEEIRQPSLTSHTAVSSDPFTSSSNLESSAPDTSSSTLLAPGDHDLLHPSVTLSSSRSAYSLASNAQSYTWKDRLFEQRRKLEQKDAFKSGPADGSSILQRHISPERDRRPQFSHRITSPSHTLSSPSSNESLESYSSQRNISSRSLSPDLHTQLTGMSLHQHMMSTSFIHQSTLLPLTSLPSDYLAPPAKSSSSSLKTTTDELTNIERPNRILTPEQISQIEAEVEAEMASASSVQYVDSSSRYGTLPTDMSQYISLTPPYAPTGSFHRFGLYTRLDSPSGFQNQGSSQGGSEIWTGERSGLGAVEGSGSRKRTYGIGPELGEADGKIKAGNYADNFLNRVPADAVLGSSSDDAVIDPTPSMSSRGILRRVRSGSSLKTPLSVHLEEEEGGIGVENISESSTRHV